MKTNERKSLEKVFAPLLFVLFCASEEDDDDDEEEEEEEEEKEKEEEEKRVGRAIARRRGGVARTAASRDLGTLFSGRRRRHEIKERSFGPHFEEKKSKKIASARREQARAASRKRWAKTRTSPRTPQKVRAKKLNAGPANNT